MSTIKEEREAQRSERIRFSPQRKSYAESWVKEQVKRVLRHYKPCWRMPASPFGRSGISDFVILFHGHFLALEAKRFAQSPWRASQRIYAAEVEANGGTYMRIHGSNLDLLVAWFENVLEKAHEPVQIQAPQPMPGNADGKGRRNNRARGKVHAES